MSTYETTGLAMTIIDSPAIDVFSCKFCGATLYGDNIEHMPTERRGWIIYIPHFCCCGRCSWDCPHDHGVLDIVCAYHREKGSV